MKWTKDTTRSPARVAASQRAIGRLAPIILRGLAVEFANSGICQICQPLFHPASDYR
ncbi:hypothetical protein H6G51_07960 [Limnothrix sp. FACHB-708]|uniref:hypothetical protein n=1 Tax=unclassified Limnothrix TaxID=2632864 RepID=UPI001682855B|nr:MULTISPECIES: hypothetical protein [unclassified Limnothrix]MBD2553209.1 hypothetical protein [Limnothrix sp. FACHB-708]MBD2590767.1 hypothetical protein [Limnothrix sp. FACHB-406]